MRMLLRCMSVKQLPDYKVKNSSIIVYISKLGNKVVTIYAICAILTGSREVFKSSLVFQKRKSGCQEKPRFVCVSCRSYPGTSRTSPKVDILGWRTHENEVSIIKIIISYNHIKYCSAGLENGHIFEWSFKNILQKGFMQKCDYKMG